MADYVDLSKIERRIAGLSDWLEKNAPNCRIEQKHLEEGSRERIYWHYGYMVALKDMMRFLKGETIATSSREDRSNKRPAA